MRTILIPTDFSENAMNAVRYAVELFKYERCEFYFMHAFADEVYGHEKVVSRELLDSFKQEIDAKTRAALDGWLEETKTFSPNPRHTYKAVSVFGSLVDEVNEFVNEQNIDVVVMGTKGHTDDKNVTFGSQTLQVLRYVQCPVLAIPADCKYVRPKEILFPTDYMLPYKRRELKLLDELACSYRSTIHLLYFTQFDHLSLRQEDNKRFLASSLSKAQLSFETRETKDKASGIQAYIEEKNIDMLVMVNSRHSFLEKILYRSTIDTIGLELKVPFLAMQNLAR